MKNTIALHSIKKYLYFLLRCVNHVLEYSNKVLLPSYKRILNFTFYTYNRNKIALFFLQILSGTRQHYLLASLERAFKISFKILLPLIMPKIPIKLLRPAPNDQRRVSWPSAMYSFGSYEVICYETANFMTATENKFSCFTANKHVRYFSNYLYNTSIMSKSV